MIPYFTTSRYRVEAMIELAKPGKNDLGVDLGSGDGRIVIAFAKKGVEMLGIELDETLLVSSRKLIIENKLSSARIEAKNIWDVDLSPFDIITIYPMPDVLEELEIKLRNEAKKGAKILTNYYPLPTWELTTTKDHIYLYIKT
ncbi:hypothetical protein BH09PAT1_BH09PAT1_5330 [soil metagenome]